MNKYIAHFLFLIILFTNYSYVFADGYIDKDVTSLNHNLNLKYEVDLFPGLKNKQNQLTGRYLVNPNSQHESLEFISKEDSLSGNKSSLQQLDEIDVAKSNLLKIKFGY